MSLRRHTGVKSTESGRAKTLLFTLKWRQASFRYGLVLDA
jgi:hypothetical protein